MTFSKISILNTDKFLYGDIEELQYSGHVSRNDYSDVFKILLVSMFIIEMLILLVTSIMIIARTWRSSNRVRDNGRFLTGEIRGTTQRVTEDPAQLSHGIEIINGDTLSHGVYIGQDTVPLSSDVYQTYSGPETMQEGDLKIVNLEYLDDEFSQNPSNLQELNPSNIEENIHRKKSVRLNIAPVHRKDLLSFIALLHLIIGQYLGLFSISFETSMSSIAGNAFIALVQSRVTSAGNLAGPHSPYLKIFTPEMRNVVIFISLLR